MNTSRTKRRRGIARKSVLAIAVFAVTWFASSAIAFAQTPNPPNRYPTMAPLEQYLMADRDAEIALARSGAPDSISRDAEVQVFTRHGYDTVAQGKNGFVCMVLRSWTAAPDDPVFWNPKIRGPVCMNAIATRSYLRLVQKKAELVLAGKTAAQIGEAIEAAINQKKVRAPEPGAMCFMMSKQAYLSDDEPANWHPHLMFFTPPTDASVWGTDVHGSPIIAAPSKSEHLTIFMIPVRQWSDGTLDFPPPSAH
jgi:hypothetical protein